MKKTAARERDRRRGDFFKERIMKTYEELKSIPNSENYHIYQYASGTAQHCKSVIAVSHGDTTYCNKQYVGRYQGICPDCLAEEISRCNAWNAEKKTADAMLASIASITVPTLGDDGRVYLPTGMVVMYKYSYDFYHADKRFSPNFTRPMPVGLVPADRTIVATATNDSNVFEYLFTVPSAIAEEYKIEKIGRKMHNSRWIYYSLLDGEQEWIHM